MLGLRAPSELQSMEDSYVLLTAPAGITGLPRFAGASLHDPLLSCSVLFGVSVSGLTALPCPALPRRLGACSAAAFASAVQPGPRALHALVAVRTAGAGRVHERRRPHPGRRHPRHAGLRSGQREACVQQTDRSHTVLFAQSRARFQAGDLAEAVIASRRSLSAGELCDRLPLR